MSGWRSGSGESDRELLDRSATAASQGASPTGTSRGAPGVVLLGLIVVVVIAVGLNGAPLRPPYRVLPPPVHDSILIVPIGAFPADRLAGLAADYATEYGLALAIGAPIPLDPAAYDPARSQYVAQGLIAAMAGGRGSATDDRIVIGVTMADVYIKGVDWDWAFALRQQGRLAVISAARMPETRYSNRWWLFRKMLTREIGFLCFNLPATDDRYDLLYRDVLGVPDLRRLNDHL